jgi:hypothetical protein
MFEKHRRINRCICLTSFSGGRTIDSLPEGVSFPPPAGIHVVSDIPLFTLKVRMSRSGHRISECKFKAARRVLGDGVRYFRDHFVIAQKAGFRLGSSAALKRRRGGDHQHVEKIGTHVVVFLVANEKLTGREQPPATYPLHRTEPAPSGK